MASPVAASVVPSCPRDGTRKYTSDNPHAVSPPTTSAKWATMPAAPTPTESRDQPVTSSGTTAIRVAYRAEPVRTGQTSTRNHAR